MTVHETLLHAVEVFARGFAFTRSFAHPYLLSRVGPVRVLRDAPRTSGDLRNEEWIVCDVGADCVHELAQKHACGRYAISAIVPKGARPLLSSLSPGEPAPWIEDLVWHA